jgi:hypothetical protein
MKRKLLTEERIEAGGVMLEKQGDMADGEREIKNWRKLRVLRGIANVKFWDDIGSEGKEGLILENIAGLRSGHKQSDFPFTRTNLLGSLCIG